jgi:RES domain-containing protein
VILWRFSQHTTLDGRGGLFASGRWHTRGREIIYCAPNPATALLEVLVHGKVRSPEAFGGFQFLKIEVPEGLAVEQVEEGQLPPDWSARHDLTRAWGDTWLRGDRTAVLIVRSVLLPETYNALINPRHADAQEVRMLSVFPYPLDPRIFAGHTAG